MPRRLNASHWLLIGCSVVVLLLGFDYARNALRAGPVLDPGPYAPAFRVGDAPPALELRDAAGRPHRIADLVSSITLLVFADDSAHSRGLLRYVQKLRKRMKGGVPEVITVAAFRPEAEPAFRQATIPDQTILYPSSETSALRDYKASPAPRIFHLSPGPRVSTIGPSPAEASIYNLGVAVAGALYFQSPRAPRAPNPAPDPVELDRTDPKLRQTAGEAGGARRVP